MKKYVITENLPAKVNTEELYNELKEINSNISSVEYMPDLTWTGGDLDGVTTPASITVKAKSEINIYSVKNKIKNHNPDKSDKEVADEKDLQKQIDALKARLEALESK